MQVKRKTCREVYVEEVMIKSLLKKIALAVTLGFVLLCAMIDGIREKDAYSKHNRIYFYNMSGKGINVITEKEGVSPTADMLIIESNGRFGLIDSGHRYDTTITDNIGNRYSVPNIDENGKERLLSSQIKNKNGKDAAVFCHEKLGIKHFDFIIATHSHSDHIGGMPYFADYTYNGGLGSLVDKNTVFLYKKYRHINAREDDLDDNSKNMYSWHNQAFIDNAVRAMQNKGAKIVDISNGLTSLDAASLDSIKYSTILDSIRSAGFEKVEYKQGEKRNPFDDTLGFKFGSMQIQLYNLFSVDGAFNENTNSIVTVITVNEKNFLSAGDLDCEHQLEQKIASHIYNNHGTIEVMKANHHGYNGSNTKAFLDNLQPAYVVIPRGNIVKNERMSGSMAWYYCSHMASFNKGIYEVGLSDRGIMVDLDKEKVQFYNITIAGDKIKYEKECGHLVNTFDYEDGWYSWAEEILSSKKRSFFYIKNNQLKTGWLKDGKYWYYLDEDSGRMDTGWKKRKWDGEERTYYFSPEATKDFPEGAMVSGVQTIDGVKYEFDTSGRLIR